MAESKLSEIFIRRVDEIAAQLDSAKSAVFFQGLTPYMLRELARHPSAVWGLADAIDSNGCLGLDSLAQLKKSAFGCLMNEEGPVFLPYEVLTDLRGAVGELYEGDILVVRNNLFDDMGEYPSPVSAEALSEAARDSDGSSMGAAAGKYYASVRQVGDGYLTMPVTVDDVISLSYIDLFEVPQSMPQSDTPVAGTQVAVPSDEYAAYRLTLCDGDAQQVSFIVDDRLFEAREQPERLVTLVHTASLLSELGVSFAVVSQKQRQESEVLDGNRLLPILKRYWGDGADFRELKIYKDPSRGKEMQIISQGEIASFAVEQAERAQRGDDGYSNIFVTAPTGAGKSLLFQLPALYLALEYNLLTVVIEPLKTLMHDQVAGLKARGVKGVVALNSDITYQQRLEGYRKIADGSVSIVYLAPELLLESSIDTILNGRRLGMVVVDEVHTVSSWGREFRPDYWYLGSYLKRLRTNGGSFPIFCLTATAVYGGKDDIVAGTLRDLELDNCKLYIGSPRRDDIDFDIRCLDRADHSGPIEDVKRDLAIDWICNAVAQNDHALVYCPYRTQVDQIVEHQPCGGKVLGFHAGYDGDYKNYVDEAFSSGQCRVMVATKAFGMGVDISDINAVYHYAPTGNLSDYVQEIGRGARREGLRAAAAVDFFAQDVRYARQLYSLSGFYQWQLKEIMAKLYRLYASRPVAKRNENMLVSPDSFSYLFARESDRTKKTNLVKSALMMVARDLEDRFNYPVIIVKPKPSYTTQYICINKDQEERFLRRYGQYVELLTKGNVRVEKHEGQGDVQVRDMGGIYCLQASKMWEDRFPNLTFDDFKRRLFGGEICGDSDSPAVSGRRILDVEYRQIFSSVENKFRKYLDAIRAALEDLMLEGRFTKDDFAKALRTQLGVTRLPFDVRLLFEALLRPTSNGYNTLDDMSFKCIVRIASQKHLAQRNAQYKVSRQHLESSMRCLSDALPKLAPKEGGSGKRRRLFLDTNGPNVRLSFAEVLQALNLASYEIRGGENPEISVRVKDAAKLKSLSTDAHYSNQVLREQDARHDYSARVMKCFFEAKLSNEARWDLIEDYFLGNDDRVAAVLGISDVSAIDAEDSFGRETDDFSDLLLGTSPGSSSESSSIMAGLRALREMRNKTAPLASQQKGTHAGGSSEDHGRVRQGSQRVNYVPPVSIVDEGESFEGCPPFKVWNKVRGDVTTTDALNEAMELKREIGRVGYEAPLYRPILKVEKSGDELHPLLVWEDASVMLFDASQVDEFALAQGVAAWTVYLLGRGTAVKELKRMVKIR